MSRPQLVETVIKNNQKLKSSVRKELRQAIRDYIKDFFAQYENFLFASPPIDPDMVANILGIEFKEEELDLGYSAELRVHPSKGFKFIGIINKAIDNEHHKRFSKFHECSHVLFDLFDVTGGAHRTPAPTQASNYYKDIKETVCDISASEMLFYYPLFEQELKNFDKQKDLCCQIQDLSEKFNASIEATMRTFIENYSEEALMFVVKEGYRKEELDYINKFAGAVSLQTKPQARPRIQYSVHNSYKTVNLHYNKSFEEESIVYKSFYSSTCEQGIINVHPYGTASKIFKFCSIPEPEMDRLLCLCIEP